MCVCVYICVVCINICLCILQQPFVLSKVFAMFGMLSPANRGALMTAAIVLFMFMG